MANYKISGLTAYPNSTFAATDKFEVSYLTGGIHYSRYLTGTQLKATIVSQTITNGVTTTAPSEDAVFDALALKADKTVYIQVACSDETTALTATAGKISFRMPHAMTLTAVRASLVTAQTSGSIFTVDINESGTSVLSTKLTIDNTESTSTTAATAYVISDSAIADDAVITVDIDQIGDSTAKGLKVTLIGTRA